MKVYRIENEQGKGPYTSVSDYRWQTRSHAGYDTPNPYQEGLNIASSQRCGFKSMYQLNKWFSCKKERKNLRKLGFKIYMFNVPVSRVVLGKKQVLFTRPKRRHEHRELIRL